MTLDRLSLMLGEITEGIKSIKIDISEIKITQSEMKKDLDKYKTKLIFLAGGFSATLSFVIAYLTHKIKGG